METYSNARGRTHCIVSCVELGILVSHSSYFLFFDTRKLKHLKTDEGHNRMQQFFTTAVSLMECPCDLPLFLLVLLSCAERCS